MPTVGNEHFPYDAKGIAMAKKRGAALSETVKFKQGAKGTMPAAAANTKAKGKPFSELAKGGK